MKIERRDFIKGALGGLALTLSGTQITFAKPAVFNGGNFPVNVFIPGNYRPPYRDAGYAAQLSRATLEVLQRHYSQKKMPVWDRRFGEVDMEKRIRNIVYWLMIAVRQSERIYPVDPAFIMAMIMKESYFYEFAVSSSLAAGICQFVQPTAQEYGMLCAGTLAEHRRAPYRRTQFAGSVGEYYKIRRDRKKYRRNHRPAKRFSLEEALEIIQRDTAGRHSKDAREHLDYLKALREFDERRRRARDNFRQYLRENAAGRDIFDRRDLQFILGFDERFTYKKPVLGMVKMIARSLKAREGNALAAAIGFNAGLSSTRAAGRYEPYGKIPAIEQSTTYLSHVLVNHFEICQKL